MLLSLYIPVMGLSGVWFRLVGVFGLVSIAPVTTRLSLALGMGEVQEEVYLKRRLE